MEFESVVRLMRCPACRADQLEFLGSQVRCRRCVAVYRCIEDKPIFHNGTLPDRVDRDKRSHSLPPPVEQFLAEIDGPVLHLGSGGREAVPDQVVDVDYLLFSNTHCAVDAHRLPFADASFAGVVSLNVFEHLRNPLVAASEIHRVLGPAGRCLIHTAFLQPFHASPGHYFNATASGCREWFSQFDIDSIEVSHNFHPGITLSWLIREIGDAVERESGTEGTKHFEDSTIGYWRRLYKDWELFPEHDSESLLDMLGSLSARAQERVAAGFELHATKPAD